MKPRVLIVDDEQNIRRMLSALLQQDSYEVMDVASGPEAMHAVEQFEPDIVLLDLVMPAGPDGISTLEQLKAQYPDIVAIMMSGKATISDAVRATKLGAFQFLEKPLTPEGILVSVRAGLDLSRARAENRALRSALDASDSIVGTSAAIGSVRSLIEQVAPTASRVLITGESGTGKELVARAIHKASPRGSRTMVSVNCAAIPRDLIESEMFGHERGAFTGALARRHGKFELADGGTLFLDEVGDLGPEAQAKLLRVLETGAFERVGGEREIKVDVRVIAATNQNLEDAIADHTFREDLYYRLNVLPIHVPPLRDRLDDIPLLVTHFVAEAAAKCGRAPPAFSDAALKHLAAHRWPGNVRELANVVERLIIMTSEPVLGAPEIHAVLSNAAGSRMGPSKNRPRGLSAALEAHETELILNAVDQAKGNVAEAARQLGTDRANLYRRMRRLGIDPHDTPVSK